ncbi:MAG: hypothetical protein AAF628_25915 [Planctomycetota bacterium]
MSAAAVDPLRDPRGFLEQHAPWLLEPALGVCVVGSAALAEACRRAGLPGPAVADLDLSWMLDDTQGEERLRRHDVFVPTTTANRARGTVAGKLGGHRIEITTLRNGKPSAVIADRIDADLRARDMTVGALAWWLGEDRICDPCGGLEDWRERRVVPVGDPAARIGEHPVRWLRYYRRAHQWSFTLATSVRKLPADPERLRRIPPEALAAEVRAVLHQCASPGRWLMELYEAGLLQTLMPEVAPQFDGRPAGPIRHHPEIGQALHLVLALEWVASRTTGLAAGERVAVGLAVLCHDLGKGLTLAADLPSHHGHEEAGAPLIETLLARLPGLADSATKRLALAVCQLHQVVRRADELRPATLVDLYDRWFRAADFPVELFAMAVGADSGGRLGLEAAGDAVRRDVAALLHWLRSSCASVDAATLRQRFPDDTAAFKSALRQARATAVVTRRDRPPASAE